MAHLLRVHCAEVKRETMARALGRRADAAPAKTAPAGFRRNVEAAAKRTARSVDVQTGAALGLPEHESDASAPVSAFGDQAEERAAAAMDLATARARDIVEEWEALDPDDRDPDDLDRDLDDGLDRVIGRALAWEAVAFASLFGELVRGSQVEAGVASAIWLTARDSHVRPAHQALQDVEFSWDEPPLSAEDADCGEDCFPGSDFGCRCVASPVPPDEI